MVGFVLSWPNTFLAKAFWVNTSNTYILKMRTLYSKAAIHNIMIHTINIQ